MQQKAMQQMEAAGMSPQDIQQAMAGMGGAGMGGMGGGGMPGMGMGRGGMGSGGRFV